MKRVGAVILVSFLGSLVLLSGRAVAGDVDGDGVEDSIDVCCDTPEGVGVDAVGRPIGDLDGDCSVDLTDFDQMQQNFTGPLGSGCCTDADCDDGDPCTIDQCDVDTGDCTSIDVPNCQSCVVPPECGIELTCGDYISGGINPIIETDVYCFCASEQENLRIHVTELAGSGANFAPNWRVLDAGGNPIGGCGTFAATAGRDCGPLPAAGNPYQVEIEDHGRNDIGLYTIHLHQYPLAADCGTTALGACEASVAGTIENVADADLFSVAAADAEMLRITVLETPGAGANFNPNWRLIDRHGVPAAPCDAFVGTVSRDCGPLKASFSPYRVEIEDGGRNDIGAITLHVQRLTASPECGVVDLACDVPLNGDTESSIDTDLYNFGVGNNEIVRVTVLERVPSGPDYAPSWRIVNNSGVASSNCSGFATSVSRDCGPLPAIGSPYRIELEDQGRNDAGLYRIHRQSLTQFRECDIVDLECIIGQNGSIDTIIDTDLFRFVAPEAEVVRVSVLEQAGSGVNFAPNWRILNAYGVPASNCSSFSTATSRDCGPLPVSGNPYRVEVEDQGRNDVGNYQAIIDFLTTGCPK